MLEKEEEFVECCMRHLGNASKLLEQVRSVDVIKFVWFGDIINVISKFYCCWSDDMLTQ